jgi:GST-like protein
MPNGQALIHLYSLPSPNGQKVSIFLEEAEIHYEAHPINMFIGEQFHPEFLKISPNNKLPAIVDKQCKSIFIDQYI